LLHSNWRFSGKHKPPLILLEAVVYRADVVSLPESL
jgi:hypothetical protein